MNRKKMKALILGANVIGVIVIISIILLYNNKTDSVSVEADEPEMEDFAANETESNSLKDIESDYKESHESKEDLEKKDSAEDEEKDEGKDKEKKVDSDNAEEGDSDTDASKPEQSNDSDGDGLSDEEESALATDPFNADTDSDGLTDGEEIRLGTDPNHNDTDRDGVRDGTEVANGTNPLKAPSSSSNSSNSNKKKESTTSKTESSNNTDKKELKCGKNQVKKDGKCVDKKPLTYSEKVKERLPSYSVSGSNPVYITDKNGTVAEIHDKNQIVIRTMDNELSAKIVNSLSGLATP